MRRPKRHDFGVNQVGDEKAESYHDLYVPTTSLRSRGPLLGISVSGDRTNQKSAIRALIPGRASP